MNPPPLPLILVLATLSTQLSSQLRAQGSLIPPPGPPAPAMKSLQQLWDKLATLETQNAALSGQLVAQGSQLDTLQEEHATISGKLTTLQTENTALKSQNDALTTLLLNLGETAGSLPWKISRVDTNGAGSISMVVAPNGHIGVSYGATGGVLKFARYNGTAWSVQTVPGATGVQATSLAFDPATNQPGIAFMTNTSGLRYAGYNGTTWTVYTFDGTAGDDGEISLAFTPSGNPAVAYEQVSSMTVKYLEATPGGLVATFASNIYPKQATDIAMAFDAAGRPVIAFGQDDGFIRCASFNGTTWSTAPVATISTPKDVSLCFSAAGTAGIAFSAGASPVLHFVERHGTVWGSPVVVDGGTDTGYTCSLAYSPGGRPAIAYYTHSGGQDLRYASFNGVAWTTATIDSEGGTGASAALDFDPQGQPVIAYTALNFSTLRVARRVPFAQP